MTDKPQIHVSGLEMLSRCGEQFRRRYIENDKIPPGVAEKVGTSTHRTIEKNMNNFIKVGSLLPVEQIQDLARDTMGSEWQSGVMLNEEEVAEGIEKVKAGAIDKAVRLSTLHAEKVAPTIQPTHVERQWVVEMQGYPMDLVGQIDLQQGSKWIRDSKTSGKTPPKTIADDSLQLTAYALAVKIIDGVIVESVNLDYLIDTKTPQAVSFPSTRDEKDFQVLLNRIERAILILERGAFQPANQTDWICSPKWCGYFSSCPFSKKPKSVQF